MDRTLTPSFGLLLLSAALGVAAPGVPVPQVDHLELEPAERIGTPIVDPASDDAEKAIQHFKLPADLQAKLWAAEPMLANPVAMAFDEKGRLYVAETHRYRTSVLDIRSYMGVLEQDLASRTIEDRSAMIHRVFGEEGAKQLSVESELIRLVEDTDGDGKANRSSVFAAGFNSELDGIAAGVLARKGKIWFNNIPSFWEFDTDPTGRVVTKRTELLRGFGVHFNYTGHDFHGVMFGPDGKLYFTIGDRGTHVVNKEGKLIDLPDMGACFRCNPDGSDFEVFAVGLRNPQEIAFDEYGNLFTGDNDCDNGDLERLVYIVEGGDSGWRIGYQHAPMGKAGPWMKDSLWKPRFPGQPAYMLPPICNIEDGPSGVAYYPGTGLTPEYAGNFFICHFKGSINRSGIQTYKIKPKGATFQIVDSKTFISGVLPTDVTFGRDGKLYLLDWVEGWPKSKKGRVYAISPLKEDPAQTKLLAEMKQLFADGMEKRDTAELVRLLAHPDQRIRQEAQFELADRGAKSVSVFEKVAADPSSSTVTRLHALWGLGQLAAANPSALAKFPAWLEDKDPEVRAQVAKLLGDHKVAATYDALLAHLKDPAPRVEFFAAQSLGKLGRAEAAEALIDLLRRNADTDTYLRHAAVYALTRLHPTEALARAAKDSSAAVRLGVILVYRRLGDPAIAQFLDDRDPYLAREAALAINDAPVNEAMPALAKKLESAPADDEPFILRTINANFRLGQASNAEALAKLAVHAGTPEVWRDEAIFQLGQWSHPPARDRVIGLYRPLPARTSTDAIAALKPVLTSLLKDPSSEIQLETITAIASLDWRDATGELETVVKDENAAGETRAAALRELDKFDDPQMPDLLNIASNAKVSAPRLAALQILAHRNADQALPVIMTMVTHGDADEQRAAFTALGALNSPTATAPLLAALERLNLGQVPVAAQFELLDAAEKSKDPQVQSKLEALKNSWAQSGDVLAPYRGALEGGDPRRGAGTFYQNPVMACVRCHKIDGDGGDAGPDLTRVGAQKSPEYLLESVIKPNAKIAAGFDVVTLTLKSGSFYTGTLTNETPESLVVRLASGQVVTVAKSDILQRQSAPSAMPEIFAQILSRRELRDLIAFLRNQTEGSVALGENPRALAALEPQPAKAPAATPSDNGEAPTTSH